MHLSVQSVLEQRVLEREDLRGWVTSFLAQIGLLNHIVSIIISRLTRYNLVTRNSSMISDQGIYALCLEIKSSKSIYYRFFIM